MRWIPVLVLAAVVRTAFADAVQMQLVSELPVGNGDGRIQYERDPNIGSSPSEIAFYSGSLLWIGEVSRGELFDVHARRMLPPPLYPPWELARLISRAAEVVFLADWLYADNGHMFSFRVVREPASLTWAKYYESPATSSRPYAIRGYVCFTGADQLVYAIDPEGGFLTSGATVELLRGWLSTTWYRSPDLRAAHARLIGTGRFIIADGIYYPASGDQMYEYFAALRTRWDFGSMVSSGHTSLPPLGLALNGDVYLGWDDIYVVTQDGATVAVIDVDSVELSTSDPRYASGTPGFWKVSPTQFTVHPNGDFYSLYAIEDEVARIHRAVKTWDTDFVAMARAGTPLGRESEARERVRGLCIMELRILRNALFALHGYAFRTFDLATYFGGYDWYEPDPNVASDASILTADQKRLLDIVVAIQAERVVVQ